MLGLERTYYVVLSLHAYPLDGLDEATDALMDAFFDDQTVTDVDVTATLAQGRIDVAMYVAARSNAEAIATATEALRSAVHTVGGLTDDWEREVADERYEASARPADLLSA